MSIQECPLHPELQGSANHRIKLPRDLSIQQCNHWTHKTSEDKKVHSMQEIACIGLSPLPLDGLSAVFASMLGDMRHATSLADEYSNLRTNAKLVETKVSARYKSRQACFAALALANTHSTVRVVTVAVRNAQLSSH